MAGDDSSAGEFNPRNLIESNFNPLQIPGRDRLVSSSTVGGPDMSGDRRVYLSIGMLEELVRIAGQSSMRRAMLVQAGVKVDLYERPDGHRYEVWTLIGRGPMPEPASGLIGSLRGGQ